MCLLLRITVGSIESLMVFVLVYFLFFFSHQVLTKIGKVVLQSAFYKLQTAAYAPEGIKHTQYTRLIFLFISQPYSLDRWRSRPFRTVWKRIIFFFFFKEEKKTQAFLAFSVCNNSRSRVFMIHVVYLELCGNSPPITIFGCLFSVLMTASFDVVFPFFLRSRIQKPGRSDVANVCEEVYLFPFFFF